MRKRAYKPYITTFVCSVCEFSKQILVDPHEPYKICCDRCEAFEEMTVKGFSVKSYVFDIVRVFQRDFESEIRDIQRDVDSLR